MTKPKTKTIKCDRCRKPFKPAKPWQRFCSTTCRVAVHQSARYDRYTRQIRDARALLADVEMFIEHDTSDEARELLQSVRVFLHGKRAAEAA
jgi:hypothetical protein